MENLKYFIPYVWLLVTYTPSSFTFNVYDLRVLDGDTIEVQRKRESSWEKVRLVYIDAPEMGQKPWGKRAKTFLISQLKKREVKVRIRGRGYYGRLLGEVWVRDKSVNLELIKKGYAFLYPWSQFETVEQAKSYKGEASLAKDRKKGVWRKRVTKPWRYRKRQKVSFLDRVSK